LHVLQEIWAQVPDKKPLRVGIALSGLAEQEAHQPDLFAHSDEVGRGFRAKAATRSN
jgi:hypothetical protein